jgi:hypothetical protein
MYNINDAIYAANILRISFDKFSPEELLRGMNIEREHGLVTPETNVTNDDVITTAKIALAHLNEYPNYYNAGYGLQVFEDFLKRKMNEN